MPTATVPIYLNDAFSNCLARSIGTCDSTQPIKRGGVLSSKPNMVLRHSVPHAFHITRRIFHPDLEVTIAPITRKLVSTPLGRKVCDRHAGFGIIVWQAGVIGFKECVEGVLPGLRGKILSERGEVGGAVAEDIEEEEGAAEVGREGCEADTFQPPAFGVGGGRIGGAQPVHEARG